MQIHEITINAKTKLDEALPNWMDPAAIAQKAKSVGQGIKSVGQNIKQTVAPAQQAYKSYSQNKKIAGVSDTALKAWSTYATNLAKANPDPARFEQLYKQALTSFVQKNLLKNQSINSAINSQEINTLINNITAQRNNAQALPLLFNKLIQQASLSTQDPSRGAGLLVKVISANPAVLQFRNKTYVIGNQGEWVDKDSGQVADPTFQAFLDQELSKATP